MESEEQAAAAATMADDAVERIEIDEDVEHTPQEESEARAMVAAFGLSKPDAEAKSEEEAETYGSFDDFASAMDLRWEGRWIECPFIKGFRVKFGAAEAAHERMARFEEAYVSAKRKGMKKGKNGELPPVTIPPVHLSQLLVQSLFGAAVLDWELTLRGKKIAFTLDEFLQYTKPGTKFARIGGWMLDELAREATARKHQVEDDRGN